MGAQVVAIAVAWGLASAVSLPLGAFLGMYFHPRKVVISTLMSFGGGALLFALAVELFAESLIHPKHMDKEEVDKHWFVPVCLILGAIVGGICFSVLNHMLDKWGAFLRRLSSTQRRLRYPFMLRVVSQLKRVEGFRNASFLELLHLTEHMKERTFAAGEIIFKDSQKEDVPIFLVVKGVVEVRNGQAMGVDQLKTTTDAENEEIEEHHARSEEGEERKRREDLVELVGAGGMFGNIECITGKFVRSSATAVDKTTVMMLDVFHALRVLRRVQARYGTVDGRELHEDRNVGGEGVTHAALRPTDNDNYLKEEEFREYYGYDREALTDDDGTDDSSALDFSVASSSPSSEDEDGSAAKRRKNISRRNKQNRKGIREKRRKLGKALKSSLVILPDSRHDYSSEDVNSELELRELPSSLQSLSDKQKTKKEEEVEDEGEKQYSNEDETSDEECEESEDEGDGEEGQNERNNTTRLSPVGSQEDFFPLGTAVDRTSTDLLRQSTELPHEIRRKHKKKRLAPPHRLFRKSQPNAPDLSAVSTAASAPQHDEEAQLEDHHDSDAHADTPHNSVLGIWLGITIDSIPESLIIGTMAVSNSISWAFIVGVFLSNLPEAMACAPGMRLQGLSRWKVMLLWGSIFITTGIGAGIGALLFTSEPVGWELAVVVFIEGLAGGAMLTMIAQTMLPEAFAHANTVVGLATLFGFLAATAVKVMGDRL
ncbi:Camp protein kinase regulatory chain [Balamuthia mandrillaris]